MHDSDINIVSRMEKQCYDYPWSRWLFRGAVRSGMSCWIVEADNKTVGYGIAQFKNNWAHLLNICIAPDYRGIGLGSKLTRHLLAEAMKLHKKLAWLEVRPDNRDAIRLYQSLGFRKARMRKNYYPSRRGRLPAIVMAKQL